MSTLRSLRVGPVLVSATLLWGTACGGNVSRGHALYSDGYYVEAAEVFERSERLLSDWPPQKRAAYGLYRGMTLMRLGDLQGASRWLAYARWVVNENPGALPGQEIAVLHESQQTLSAHLGRPDFGAPPGAVMVNSEPPSAGESPADPAVPGSAPSTPGAKNPPPSRKSFAD